ncbi:MAG: HAMP domain-containing sensor histidine kinase [Balneolaceae bacterium]
MQKETVSLNDSVYRKITLNPLSDTLDPPMLHSYMEMAEKFVHQFRSPLTGSHGYLEMFMEQFTPKEEPSTSYLSKMEKGLDQSFQLLNQIEEFATPVSIENSTFSLNSFILSIFENFNEDEIRRISISKPEDPVEFHSDFFILRKIVIELIRNGLEASPETNEKKVWVKFHNEGIIEVRNTLMNFPEENLKRIFLPFYSTKALQMGLGLPKCRLYSHKLHLDFQVGFDTDENEISFQISGYPFTFD